MAFKNFKITDHRSPTRFNQLRFCVRELYEETGLKISEGELTFAAKVAPDNGIISGLVAVYIAKTSSPMFEIQKELGLEQFKLFLIAEVQQLIEMSQIVDSFTQIAFFKAIEAMLY